MVTTASVAIIDTLNSLLEAELRSALSLMGEGSPFLRSAPPDVREALREMSDANARHCDELSKAITDLGGTPVSRAAAQPEEPYLGYLSLRFLLPKLVDELELKIRRYDNALGAHPKTAPPQVPALLKSQQNDHRQQLEVLRQKSQEVIAASR